MVGIGLLISLNLENEIPRRKQGDTGKIFLGNIGKQGKIRENRIK